MVGARATRGAGGPRTRRRPLFFREVKLLAVACLDSEFRVTLCHVTTCEMGFQEVVGRRLCKRRVCPEVACETTCALNVLEVRGIGDASAFSQHVWERVRQLHEENCSLPLELSAKKAVTMLHGCGTSCARRGEWSGGGLQPRRAMSA